MAFVAASFAAFVTVVAASFAAFVAVVAASFTASVAVAVVLDACAYTSSAANESHSSMPEPERRLMMASPSA